MHEVLVNRLGGLSLPRKSVVRLTDRPDMTLDVYSGRKTAIQQHYPIDLQIVVVYKPPSTSYYTFSNIFQYVLFPCIDKMKPLVIIGDFNINVTQKTSRIEEYMNRTLKCCQLNHKPSTENGSTIDLVFTNCDGEIGI